MTKKTQGLHNKIQIGAQQDFQEKESNETKKKKEERFNPMGQMSMRQRRTDRLLCRALKSIYIL